MATPLEQLRAKSQENTSKEKTLTPLEVYRQTHPVEPSTLSKVGEFVKPIAQDLYSTAATIPVRAAQAEELVRTQAFGSKDSQKKAMEFASQPVDIGFGTTVKPLDTSSIGRAAQQTAGDILKTASLTNIGGKLTLAKQAALQGGAYGLGNAMSEGKSAVQTVKDTALGAAGGAVLGKGLSVAGKLFKDVPKEVNPTASEVTAKVEPTATTPTPVTSKSEVITYPRPKVTPEQGRVVYRSTEKPFDKNLIDERGIFTTPDKSYAENWKMGKGRTVEKLIINNDAKILSKDSIPKEFYSTEDGIKFINDESKLIKYAKDNGYDGYENVSNINGKDFEPEIVVFNKNKINKVESTTPKLVSYTKDPVQSLTKVMETELPPNADPTFVSTTLANQTAKYDAVASVTPTDELIDMAMGLKPIPEGLNPVSIHALTSIRNDLTVEQAMRLKNIYPLSQAGQDLSLARLKSGAVIDNPVDMMQSVEKELKQQVVKKGINKNDIKNLFPDCGFN